MCPTCGVGKDHTSTEDVAEGIATSGEGIATSGEGPSSIPKNKKGFGKLGSSSLGPGFANCQDVHLLVF